MANSGYQYQYSGKEWQDELGLNVYDLGARNYDPAIGRMPTIDPKAEQYNFQSPYAFANNNPVFFVDINGEGVDTDYVLNRNNGKITRKDPKDGSENRTDDRLFATDKNGKVDEGVTPLTINKEKASDDTVISKMSIDNIWKKKYMFADDIPKVLETNITISTSKTETFNFFKFVADNSNTEWSVDKFSNGNQSFYQIGTYHNTYPYTDASPGFLFDGKNNGYKWMGSVHSHYVPRKLSESGILNDQNRGPEMQKKYGRQFPYMVYHPNVKNKPIYNFNSNGKNFVSTFRF